MSTAFGGIDYDQLAAALLRAGAVQSGMPLNVAGERNPTTDGHDARLKETASSTDVGLRQEVSGGVRGVVKGKSSATDGEDAQPKEVASSTDAEGQHDVGRRKKVGGGVFSPKLKPKSVGEDVKRLKFGGLVDSYEGLAVSAPAGTTGFFATYVRTPDAKELKRKVEDVIGAKLPRAAAVDCAVCTYSAGTMPVELATGKVRLNGLAAVGDAALTYNLVADTVGRGGNAEEVQRVRSRVTSNSMLRNVCRAMGFADNVRLPPNVDPATAKSLATAFEAIVGMIAAYRGNECVVRFMRAAQLLGDTAVVVGADVRGASVPVADCSSVSSGSWADDFDN